MALLKIQVATAEDAVIRLHPADNVAIARVALSAGQPVFQFRAAGPIPLGHKVALAEIPAGAPVMKYGFPIGTARLAIRPGDHVHTHNVLVHEAAESRHTGALADRGPAHEWARTASFLG